MPSPRIWKSGRSTSHFTNEVPPPSYQASVNKTSNLDITSHIERKLTQYNASQNIFKRWLFEIVSVAISAVCMGAIVAILISLQDQPRTKWPLGLTFITILSKIASATLILPISEAIGQLKWSWFHGKESKDAFDFEIFDKASRGAWGSFLLLIRTKGKSLAALGALLTVLLLAIDSFFQQVTDLPERLVLRGQGLIPRTIRYEPQLVYTYQTGTQFPIAQANQDLKAALTPYFYDQNGTHHVASDNGSQADFPLSCPTSVCKWAPYRTLGVCSACVDVSNLLTYACLPMKMDWILGSAGDKAEATWPNGTACGYFLNATSVTPVLMSGYRVDNGNNGSIYGETLLMRTMPLVTNPSREALYDGSINFRNITNPILDALIVSSADGSPESVYRKELPIAHECMLSFCVKTLRSSYSWGIYEESVEETFYNTTRAPYPWSTTYHPEARLTETFYYRNTSIYTPEMDRDQPGYGLSNETALEFVLRFDEIFPSMITVANRAAERFLKIRTSFNDRVVFRAVHFNPWLAPNNVTHHMERIATALTNAIKSGSDSNELIAGQALAPETYVKVYWAWLAFPLAMLSLCVVFLIATLIKTSQDADGDIGTWKTSAMPTLIYSLPQHTRHDLTAIATRRGRTDGGVKKVKIRLVPNHGWRVSGQLSASPTLFRRVESRAPSGWI